MKEQLVSLYRRRFGEHPASILDLRPDGSNRRIFRLISGDGEPAIGVYGPDREENRAFLSFSGSLRSAGLPVPEIYDADEEAGIYLEEDLGDTTLFERLQGARTGDLFPTDLVPIYRRVVEILPQFQVTGAGVVDFSVAYPRAEFDRQAIMWDLNYFKYHFLKLAGIDFNEGRLENDFETFCDFLLQADRRHFMYRDFQSRNIMLRDTEPWFIDYQGGRRGALQYDIASLLYDAKAALPDPVRDALLEHYLDALSTLLPVDRGQFVEHYRGYVLVRIMQAMGAYGFRGFFEGKAHFIASVPFAVANIRSILARGPLPVELPELRAVLERIASRSEWGVESRGGEEPKEESRVESRGVEESGSAGGGFGEWGKRGEDETDSGVHVANANEGRSALSGGDSDERVVGLEDNDIESRLTVHIRSFSYKRGYPADDAGHGGGFVFDCRALHNPGRYQEYKALCGRDTPVVEFLQAESGTEDFFVAVTTLVDAAVANYLERGFEHLSVAFGCTGGQHRSVYFSERLARHLKEHFPGVELSLEHREEGRWMR